MGGRIRAIEEARRTWRWLEREIADQLRTARLVLGATQRQIGDVIGASTSELSRRELARSRRFTGEQLAIHAAAVGLKPSIKLVPVGGGILDATG